MQPITARRTRRILVILSIFGGAWRITLTSARSQTKWVPTPGGDPVPRGPGVSSPGRLEIHCAAVEALIQRGYVGFANGVSFNRAELGIGGVPDWIRSARYDISAKELGSAHMAQMSGPMLQRLLEDRFQLPALSRHKAGRRLRADGGKEWPQIKAHERGCTPMDLDHWPPTPQPLGQPNAVICGSFRTPRSIPGTMKFAVDGMTMADFSQ
jgi:uncharacterized protein (TIGR03435 family)